MGVPVEAFETNGRSRRSEASAKFQIELERLMDWQRKCLTLWSLRLYVSQIPENASPRAPEDESTSVGQEDDLSENGQP